jgi:O-antigen ligase
MLSYTSLINIKNSNFGNLMTSLVVIFIAISLNILLTLKFNDSHIGIRVAATDFIVPFVLLFFIFEVIKKKQLPELSVTYGWKLLGLMSLWMLISLINGYAYIGEMTIWALVNKFFGWFILLFYFMSGVCIGIQRNKAKIIFVRSLLVTAWMICLAELIVHWYFAHGYFHEYAYVANHYRMQGSYQNPNAFGIFLSVLFILQVFAIRKSLIFSRVVLTIGSTITLLCVFYSFSRSAWIGLLLALIAAGIMDRRILKWVVIVFFSAYVLNLMVFSENTKSINTKIIEYTYFDAEKIIAKSQDVYARLKEEKDKSEKKINHKIRPNEKSLVKVPSPPQIKVSKEKIVKTKPTQLTVKRLTAVDRVKSDGLSTRIEIFHRSISYWKEKPFIGIGLGGHIWNSQKEGVHSDSVTIHNSLNWLLVETGVIGILIFLSIILLSIKSLYKYRSVTCDFLPTSTMISIIFLFIGASLATEVIYQRYFWLLLGLFLVKIETQST